MTLTLDLPPAEEAELRRLAAAGDLPAVRAALADRLDELAAGVGPPRTDPAVGPLTARYRTDPEYRRRVDEGVAELTAATAGFAADFPPDHVPLTNEELRRVNLYDD